MVQQLTSGERQNALVILLCIFVAGRGHGRARRLRSARRARGHRPALRRAASRALVMRSYYEPEPTRIACRNTMTIRSRPASP